MCRHLLHHSVRPDRTPDPIHETYAALGQLIHHQGKLVVQKTNMLIPDSLVDLLRSWIDRIEHSRAEQRRQVRSHLVMEHRLR